MIDEGRMTRVRTAIRPIVFGPNNLRMLTRIFDEVCACVANDFDNYPDLVKLIGISRKLYDYPAEYATRFRALKSMIAGHKF